jgi:hypothetical protein
MPPDERLSLAAQHVTFELDQVASLPAQIERFEREGSTSGIACFESFLLHARNLIDFLLGSHDPDEIQRTDYIEGWNPPKSAASRRLRDVLPVLHERLAHLSWRRIEASDVRVDQRQIAHDVMTVIGAFVQKLEENSSPHAEWFRTAFDANRRVLGPLPSDRSVYSTSGAYDRVIVLRAWNVDEASGLQG